jgi:hypothetical protein
VPVNHSSIGAEHKESHNTMNLLGKIFKNNPLSIPDSGASTEFVTQLLEPMGGKILRPKDWFYSEGHRGPTFLWTLSREDTSNHRGYVTGMRIQMFLNIKDGAGKTQRQFAMDNAAAIQKKASRIITSWPEQQQDLFSRIGFEAEEGPYHIVYSFFWGNNMDMAVVTTAGTTRELWNTYTSTFEKMSDFELIDMKCFEQQKNL